MDHSRLERRSWRACAVCVCGWALLLAASGCSRRPPEVKGTEDDARAALASALDAWLAGHKPDVLQDGTPPVWMIDQDWRAGKTLKAYRTPETPEKFGGHWKVATTIRPPSRVMAKIRPPTV